MNLAKSWLYVRFNITRNNDKIHLLDARYLFTQLNIHALLTCYTKKKRKPHMYRIKNKFYLSKIVETYIVILWST